MLDVRIASKSFGGRPILRDVAFHIQRGEVVGLLGPSGVGKSTLLRTILGLDTAFQGEIRRDYRRAGVVFQEPRLLPWLTVEENIRLVVTHDMPDPDIPALLETVELGHVAKQRPNQLSLGMARRVSLARALAISPELLVLDEPFASLDVRLGAALFDSVARWAARTGATVLLATHDLAQALERVSRVLVVAGSPAALLSDEMVPTGGRAGVYSRLTADYAFLSADCPRPEE